MSCGNHAALLTNPAADITRFISQSDCLRFAYDQIIQHDEAKAYFDKSIENVAQHRITVIRPIHSILESSRLRDAIFRIDKLGGALPVVTALMRSAA